MQHKIGSIFKLLMLLLLFGKETLAQQSSFHGWLVSSHEQKLRGKWSFLSDVQLRSSEKWKHAEVLLFRPGLRYEIGDDRSAAIGYAYQGSWEEGTGKRIFELEHRLWEQFLMKSKLGKAELSNRLRLEQRFLEKPDDFGFAQRIRYYIRYELPISEDRKKNTGSFSVLQNELFLNIQNKEQVNNSFFDQNRVYAGFGYRFSTVLDIEAGYLYRYQITGTRENHHIVQVTIGTTL